MNNYNDIIYLPHYTSKKRKRMSLYNRSAQFASFKALTGYEDKIEEVARLTNKKIELDDGRKLILNQKLCVFKENIQYKPNIEITYFIPDKKKSGGIYKTITGNVRRIDEVYKKLILTDGKEISIDDIIDLKSSWLKNINAF